MKFSYLSYKNEYKNYFYPKEVFEKEKGDI